MAESRTAEISAWPASDGAANQRRRLRRRELLAARRALPASEWLRLSQLIRTHVRQGFPDLCTMRVGFCWPVHNEPDLRPLLAEWYARANPGFCALLPVATGGQRTLAFRVWRPDTLLRPDVYGIPAPATGDFVEPQALLIPLVGFDAAGYRLGYGGGHFDCTLASLSPRPLAIGVGFELGRLDSIFPAAHDQPLDAIVSEAGVFPGRRADAQDAPDGGRVRTNAATSSAGIGRASQ
ncbi:MAG TPA: 5-formyltetrahydrofolate cyclo-ligase [Accumulibacter sp.]|uniref:5-formyltetrahydrofolate cyclo-ligase n=1 Tax=Accumulibacter sp. TaxID=2053492 RepID=UPI002D0EFA2F|nr:5-formyltetrahydrofolate cyclo-ligase [Accumulibacter sp.]HMX69142.1 5-formyltetrahydrofolate cyclo-ligase [Accumulibacter sp.]HNE40310.1 5-formyltetrahydrofolate cyclo-ligase [Accumulibacter sp.]HNG14280.1 5-formyltetrahydrofolate cyclo-ligase [Accumulibacter sp.]HNG85982.1 5-formyltetrahydrofolate cyclo-ligase [Accumulibacter sp.]HNK01823.1 5-formyltetrahydrofolate cyclo-ligase [Accumulibacter sp.]